MSDTHQPPPLDSAATSGSWTQFIKRKRILIAESDGFTRVVLMLLFRMVGFKVDFAANGIMALRKFRAYTPDVFLVELKLNGRSGMELIRVARSDPQFKNLPIYVFTHVDEMKRSTRKELQKCVTQIFDKRSISREDLVKSILADLAKERAQSMPKAASKKELAAPPMPELVPVPISETEALETLQPEEIEELIGGVREQSDQVMKCKPEERLESCTELLSRVSSLSSCAEVGGLRNLARQAKVLERFLEEICKQAERLADATLITVTRAVEVLGTLTGGQAGEEKALTQFNAAVIDESEPSGKSVSEALREAGFNPTTFNDSTRAVEYLTSHSADLIVANVCLPELHGLELAAIRKLPPHAATPVIFVSGPPALDSKEALPTSAPSVNKNPLLLRELIMKALNAVHSKGLASGPPLLDSPPPTPPAAQPFVPRAEEFKKLNGAPEPVSATPALEADPIAQLPADLPASIAPAPTHADPFLARSQPANRIIEESTEGNHGKKTILFIEDDQFALKVYGKGLRRAGFNVQVAEDGMDALDALWRVKPDLVVLDLMLPELPGLEVLRFMRSDANLKDTPVIVLSNAYVDELAAQARLAGANRGLLKTECTPAKLVEEICDLLRCSKATASLEAVDAEPMLSSDVDLVAETAIWTRQAGLRKAAPKEVAKIRQLCLSWIKTADDEQSLPQLRDLYRRVHFLSAHAALIGFTKIADLSSVLEGLLFELVCKQSVPTSSTFQTLAQAVDLLDQLVQGDDTTFAEPRVSPKVLVIDEDAECNVALASALKRGKFEVLCTQDPLQSLQLLNSDSFDLVLLEIDMPHMSGFELCEQLRRTPQHKSVPVLFVTVNAEFQNRARSVIAGGNDLIAKPVSPLELILKVMLHLLKRNGDSQTASKVQAPVEAEESSPDRLVEPSVTEPEEVVAPLGAQAAATAAEAPAHAWTSLSISPMAETPATDRRFEMPQARAADSEPANLLQPETVSQGSSFEGDTESGSNDYSSAPAPQTDGHEGNDPLQVECTKLRQAVAKYQTERETLVNRILTSENDLHRANARIQRRQDALQNLQKELDELKQQRPTGEASQRLQELENELSRRTAELEAAKNDWEQKAKERERIESDLRQELESARAATQQTETAQQQAQSRVSALEKELTGLRQVGEELYSRFAKEQQTSTEAANRAKELETNLNQRTADWERAKTEWEKRAKEREQVESDLRRQLESAGAAAKQTETAHQQAQSRVVQLEQELAGLRQAREELDSKFGKEQQTSTESANRVKELETNLNQRTADWERAKTEWEKQAKERDQVESDLRAQLQAAGATAKQTETAHQQAQARVAQLEQELAGLRQVREELNSKFGKEQQASTESANRVKALETHLNQLTADWGRAKAEWEKQSKERERAESALQQELESACAATRQSETAHKEAQERCRKLEQELAGLQQAGEQLKAGFDKEQRTSVELADRIKELEKYISRRSAEFERDKGELEKQVAERSRVESDLRRQLEATGSAGKQTEAAHQHAQSRITQLEQELAGVRQAGEELNNKFAKEQQVSVESGNRVKELEKQLSQRAADLERAMGEHDKQAKERDRLESGLRQKLESAQGASRQTETAHQQAQARVGQLEQELAGLRHVREELDSKFAKEQQVSVESGNRVKELENHLTQRTADLERAKAEHEKQTKERDRLEAELRQKLETAHAATKQTETAHQQAQARVAQLEQDLAGLRQAREELNSRFAREQQLNSESANRVKELENHLSQRTADLERVREELDKQAQTHKRVHADLSTQLDAKGVAHTRAQSRIAQLEQDLAGLRQTGAELNSKFAKEQQLSTESGNRVKELENFLSQRAAELERTRGELEKQTESHKRAHSDLSAQLDAAGVAHNRAQSRVAQLEQELAGLRQVGEELNSRFTKEQQVSAESGHRVKELENSLNQRAADLERAKAELEKLTESHNRAHSDLSAQLDAASTSHTRAQSRVAQLEQEVAGLRQTGQELSSRFTKEQQVSTESGNRVKELETTLSQRAADLERAKADLEKEAEAHKRTQSDFSGQLNTACAAHTRAQAKVDQLEQEIVGLRQTSDELNWKFTQEQQLSTASANRIKELENNLNQRTLDLERAKADLEKEADTHKRAHSDLSTQLEAAGAAQTRAQARVAQLEQELTGLRQAGEELNRKFAKEQQVSTESGNRVKELENTLSQRAAELERARAELEKQADTHRRTHSDLSAQLETAAVAHTTAQSRIAQLEPELAQLRQVHEGLNSRFAKEQNRGAELQALNKQLERELQSEKAALQAQTSELEQQINHGVASLARVTADLAKETGARQRSDERAATLNLRLQEMHAESSRLLQAQRADAERISSLETQVRHRDETIARGTADLEQKNAECLLARDQLQQTRELNAHLRKNASFVEKAHQTLNSAHSDLQSRLQTSLDSLQQSDSTLTRETAERQRLATALDGSQRELQAQGRQRESLETELQSSLQAVREVESKLQQEAAERQRLATALEGVQRDLRYQSQKREMVEAELQRAIQALRENQTRADKETAERQRIAQALDSAQLDLRARSARADLELSKLQSALEFEQVQRKQHEAQMARMRHITLDSARGARSLRNTLRRQTREPVESLYQSARTLLQLDLGNDQKRLAEGILQDALLVQARLQELERRDHGQAAAETDTSVSSEAVASGE